MNIVRTNRAGMMTPWMRYVLLFTVITVLNIPSLQAQYFGRNRPSYRTFDFKVYESPNFTIYHYFDNDSVINALANRFEHWYIRHQALFTDTFEKPSPILIYQNHPDFQQTTAVGGMIGQGTQGVTEALKNRVVIPVLESNSQTDHVIGHELVHVFHFRALFIDDSLSLNSLRNLPLWLVEGMAEYFSIGSVDAHTAMIIRDAIKQDDFPSLKEMTRNYSYNPYRYGHAFVAFVGRTWGDDIIAPLYRETAKFGYERAIERVIGLNATTVSNLWESATRTHVQSFMEDTTKHIPIGSSVLNDDNAGNLNISPSLSPDGNHVAFFSEKDLFSLDLFLANAKTGKITRKLSSTTRSADIDAFNFFESVGTWSPDGRKFVHVAVKKGRNQLVVVDTKRPRRSRHIPVDGVPLLNNPAWSPDGRHVVFSGLVDGIGNLYQLDMQTRKVERLTNDRYSYLHPSWSPDGRYLTFATDRMPGQENSDNELNYNFYIGVMDMESPDRNIEVLNIFPSADNVNPVFDSGGKGIYFLSNRDGFRNLYHYDLQEQKVFQLTDYFTGISGITHLSPAITVARNTGEVAYSYFEEGKYSVYRAQPSDFLRIEVDPMAIDMMPATLAPVQRNSFPVVDNFLKEIPKNLPSRLTLLR
jgi:WD40 repeat protein